MIRRRPGFSASSSSLLSPQARLSVPYLALYRRYSRDNLGHSHYCLLCTSGHIDKLRPFPPAGLAFRFFISTTRQKASPRLDSCMPAPVMPISKEFCSARATAARRHAHGPSRLALFGARAEARVDDEIATPTKPLALGVPMHRRRSSLLLGIAWWGDLAESHKSSTRTAALRARQTHCHRRCCGWIEPSWKRLRRQVRNVRQYCL
ncbi:hypothetical protein V8C26DRAFT_197096 [Trichoderma gracile]